MGSLRSVGTRPHPNHRQPITEQEAERKEEEKKQRERQESHASKKFTVRKQNVFFFQRAKERGEGGECVSQRGVAGVRSSLGGATEPDTAVKTNSSFGARRFHTQGFFAAHQRVCLASGYS